MKIAALVALLLPMIAHSATIEGAYFRLSAGALIVDSILVRGADGLRANSDELRHSFSDYYLRLGPGRALIREGDVVLIDPDRMDAIVKFSHEAEAEGFRVMTLVCQYKEEVAAGVMISPVPGSEPRETNPGIYFSIRAADYSDLLPAFSAFVLGSELRFKAREYRSLEKAGLKDALHAIESFLKQKANQTSEPTAPSGRGSP